MSDTQDAINHGQTVSGILPANSEPSYEDVANHAEATAYEFAASPDGAIEQVLLDPLHVDTPELVPLAKKERGSIGKWVATAVAIGAAATGSVIFALSSGEDSENKQVVTQTNEQPANNNPNTNKTPENVQNISDILPTPEKSPEDIVKAHIKLQDLSATTLREDLVPYLFYNTDPSSNPKLQTHLDLIEELERVRGMIGPVGVYTDSNSISLEIIRNDGEEIESRNAATTIIIDWDDPTRQFVKKTILYTGVDVYRKSSVGANDYWVLYSHQQLELPQKLEEKFINKKSAFKLLYDSWDKMDALRNYLGLEN